MKKITKMKLINWHQFHNQTIDITDNVMLTGENGTGKSTILDAIQFVLTAGKVKFNSAANDSAKRSIKTYMRAKLGVEGKEVLRTGAVISVIALEYFDEKSGKSNVLGVHLTLSESDYLRKLFFNYQGTISDDYFFNAHHVKERVNFRKTIQQIDSNASFVEKEDEARELFRRIMGVDKKYADLIPRALAFKPLSKVDEFIFEFILKEESIDIPVLSENIRNYRLLENKLKEVEEKIAALTHIDETYNSFIQAKENIKTSKDLTIYYQIKQTQDTLNQIHKNITIHTSEIEAISNQLLTLEQQRIDLSNQQHHYQSLLDGNADYQQMKELKNELERSKMTLAQKEKAYQSFMKEFHQEIEIYKKLRLFAPFVEKVQEASYDTSLLRSSLNTITQELLSRNDQLQKELSKIEYDLDKQRSDEQALKAIHARLKQHRFSYKPEMERLLKILKEELLAHYGKPIEVRPVCEYLEIQDEEWRQAIEGYMNTQRFDLIIEPEYYDFAAKVYEAHHKKDRLFNTGIVNCARLLQYDKVDENSVATLISSKNRYALLYAKMILGRVTKANSVEEMKQYRTALTKSCMVYKNYTLRALNPKVYEIPYIGIEAYKLQIKLIETKLNQLKETMNEKTKIQKTHEKKLYLIRQSKSALLVKQVSIIDEYHTIKQATTSLQKQYDAIKNNPTYIDYLNALEKVQKELNALNQTISEKYTFKGQQQESLKGAQEELLQSEQKLESLQSQDIDFHIYQQQITYFNEKYKKNYQRTLNELHTIIVDGENTLHMKENQVIQNMHDFNLVFDTGYEESINGYHQYQDELMRLRDIEVVERQSEVIEAKRKSEASFQESFISKLQSNIKNARREIDQLNKGLVEIDFNGDRYRFICTKSKNPRYSRYYDIIMSGQQFYSEDLFTTSLSDENRAIMGELFDRLSDYEQGDDAIEQALRDFTDYRRYLSYDIEITHENGDVTLYSKVSDEKSGGETQTPFYVVIASSFQQRIKERPNEDSGCVVLFDEAFNNMDETRIQEMMKFYRELNIQIILAVPPARAETIMPYIETTLVVVKTSENAAIVRGINHAREGL